MPPSYTPAIPLAPSTLCSLWKELRVPGGKRAQVELEISLVIAGIRLAVIFDPCYLDQAKLERIIATVNALYKTPILIGIFALSGDLSYIVNRTMLRSRLSRVPWACEQWPPLQLVNVSPLLSTFQMIDDRTADALTSLLEDALRAKDIAFATVISIPDLPPSPSSLLHPIALSAYLLEYPVAYTLPYAPAGSHQLAPMQGNILAGTPLTVVRLAAEDSSGEHQLLSFSYPATSPISDAHIEELLGRRWNARTHPPLTLWLGPLSITFTPTTLDRVAL